MSAPLRIVARDRMREAVRLGVVEMRTHKVKNQVTPIYRLK